MNTVFRCFPTCLSEGGRHGKRRGPGAGECLVSSRDSKEAGVTAVVRAGEKQSEVRSEWGFGAESLPGPYRPL